MTWLFSSVRMLPCPYKSLLQSGNQLLLKPDAVKSERRFVFAKQRTMTLIFITKRTELH